MLGTTNERSGQTKQMVSLQEGEINLKYYDIVAVSETSDAFHDLRYAYLRLVRNCGFLSEGLLGSPRGNPWAS